jgi:RNA polymerase sigma-70 factor (ECF subfamily)
MAVTAQDERSDEDLVGEVISGSHDALAALYDRHVRAVHAAAMRSTGDRWTAGEVVQETFLALWDRAERFDPARGHLGAWLVTIARNRGIDHLRAAARHQRAVTFSSFGQDAVDEPSLVEWLTTTGELIAAAGPEPLPEAALSMRETRATIADAVASLDPAEQQVIALAYGDGLTQVEIAAELGWPLGTVKTRTRRALRQLRERLEPPPSPAMVRPAFDPCGVAPVPSR